jgi:hypothetical protein
MAANLEAQQPQNIIYSTNEPPANPSIDAAPTPSSYLSVPTTMEDVLVPPIKHNARTPVRGDSDNVLQHGGEIGEPCANPSIDEARTDTAPQSIIAKLNQGNLKLTAQYCFPLQFQSPFILLYLKNYSHDMLSYSRVRKTMK